MLHILLLILKIIGCIILTVLGLILLIILLILFTPLRYEIEAQCKGELESLTTSARISFFLRIIRFSIHYSDKTLKWQAHLAWKKISSEISNDSDDKTTATDSSYELEEFSIDTASVSSTVPEKTERSTDTNSIDQERKSNTIKTISKNGTKAQEDKTLSKKPTDSSSESSGIEEKINSVIEKIKYTMEKICAMIEKAEQIKEIILNFISNEQHKAAFSKLLEEIKRLLKKLKPKKLKADIEFGLSDPATTGKLLAGYSIAYPYIKDNIKFVPDFEEQKFIGEIYMKGRVRLSMFASFALYLIINKNVRITISHILKLVKKGGK